MFSAYVSYTFSIKVPKTDTNVFGTWELLILGFSSAYQIMSCSHNGSTQCNSNLLIYALSFLNLQEYQTVQEMLIAADI